MISTTLPRTRCRDSETAHPGGFNAAFSDGSIRFIAATTDPENFLRMLMMADGQPVRF